MTATCETCRYAAPSHGYMRYECRRMAPGMKTVPVHLDLREHVPVWPIVRADDWCGEHKLKGNL